MFGPPGTGKTLMGCAVQGCVLVDLDRYFLLLDQRSRNSTAYPYGWSQSLFKCCGHGGKSLTDPIPSILL
jgi:hypothetical protein